MDDPQQKSAATAKPKPPPQPEPPPITINLNLNAIVQLNNVPGQSDQLAQILALLQALTTQGGLIMAAIDDLEASVAGIPTVVDSVLALLTQLAQLLADAIASGNPARIQAVQTMIDTQKQRLVDAVVAGTPAQP